MSEDEKWWLALIINSLPAYMIMWLDWKRYKKENAPNKPSDGHEADK